VRKTSRLAEDIPLALASDRLWAGMAARTGRDVGYRQAGIMFNARSEVQMAMYEGWLQSVRHLQLDSRLLSREEIARHVPGGSEKWAGGFYPFGRPGGTDAGLKRNSPRGDGTGAVIVENCAVRTLSTAAGRVSGVITERGEIRCEQVLLAGGMVAALSR
jgi:glycine/D-amino acid oxidase-like deaminating enzyme